MSLQAGINPTIFNASHQLSLHEMGAGGFYRLNWTVSVFSTTSKAVIASGLVLMTERDGISHHLNSLGGQKKKLNSLSFS